MIKFALLLLIVIIIALILLLIFALGVVLGASGKLYGLIKKSHTESKQTKKTVEEKKHIKAWNKFLQYDGSSPQDVIDRK